MARFTVVGGPSTLEQHKKMLQEYRIRQVYIDGAKTSSSRSGRPAMNSNFMTFAPTNSTTGSRLYTKNVLRNQPAWVSDEVGRAFREGAMSGGRLYGSDLGWSAAEYAENRLTARRSSAKKEDNSTWNSDPNKSYTTGRPKGKKDEIVEAGQSTPPTTPASTTTPTTSTDTASATPPTEPSENTSGKTRSATAKTDVTDNAAGAIKPGELAPKQAEPTAPRVSAFDKFAKSDLGISNGGLKTAHSLVSSSGVSTGQAVVLTSVLDNWDNDGFISSIPPDELSQAISSLTAKVQAGAHTEHDLKILKALTDRVNKVEASRAKARAGAAVAEALN